jgi:hypothetical protein
MNKERDDDIAIDAIRDYFKTNGYKTSLDSLEKEIKLIESNEKNNKNKVY